MNDNEARDIILHKISDLRDTGRFINIGHLDDLGFNRLALDRYLTQLEQLNFVSMKALRDGSGLVDAMIQITPYGTESIERPKIAPSQIVIIRGNVHVGDNKTQEIRMGIGKVEAAMDHSQITKTEQPQNKTAIGQIVGIVKSLFSGSEIGV